LIFYQFSPIYLEDCRSTPAEGTKRLIQTNNVDERLGKDVLEDSLVITIIGRTLDYVVCDNVDIVVEVKEADGGGEDDC
jgi:hypothetical protein